MRKKQTRFAGFLRGFCSTLIVLLIALMVMFGIARTKAVTERVEFGITGIKILQIHAGLFLRNG